MVLEMSSASVSGNSTSLPKKEIIQRWIQKLSQTLQTDETKKMLQVFVLDPILNHILERLFPYIVIMCVLFVTLTVTISVAILVIFNRLPNLLRA
jgi:hypothetical protein